MAGYRRLEINEVGDVTVVHFRDHRILEDWTIQEWGKELLQLVEAENRTRLVLNFATVDFLSSAALGKLISLNNHVRNRRGTLRLCSIRPEIHEIFVLTSLDRLFAIHQDEADALAVS